TLKKSISKLDDYIYLVEGDWELAKLDDYSRKNLTVENQYYLYSFLIDDLKSDFDFIIFDSVPTTSLFTHNCIVASDYVIAPTQAEEDSYKNTISYISYLNSMQEYNDNLDILGIVPYLTKDDNATNRNYLEKYYETFENLTFTNIVKYSGRVLSWGTTGITENKGYDKQTLNMYFNVFKEFLERLNRKLD
ncbi:ParA family protein, partial [Lactococcus sp. dk322]|uniref:ParA family protein n=1 Tax=Lactococcus sp. dk322 TaxID=2603290 RepID=UPI0011CA31B8